MEKRAIGQAGDGVELCNMRQSLFDPMSSDGGAQCCGDRLQEAGVFPAKAARIAPVGTQDSKRSIGCRDRDLDTAQQAMALHERRKNGVSGAVYVRHHHRVALSSARRGSKTLGRR